jgi:hypothetical protein
VTESCKTVSTLNKKWQGRPPQEKEETTMSLRELRNWIDEQSRDTYSLRQFVFYTLQQEFESDFDYPLGAVISSARHAIEFFQDNPEKVTAYHEFLEKAATVI